MPKLAVQSTDKDLSKKNLKKLKIKEKHELRRLGKQKNIQFYIIVRKENVSLLSVTMIWLMFKIICQQPKATLQATRKLSLWVASPALK